jgi:CheY-like chemotaxis protein
VPAYEQDYGDRTVSSQKKPQSTAAAGNAAPSNASTLFAEAKTVAQFRFRILVVDDEPSIRETARISLEGEGYEVLTAADGIEGLHSLSKSLPDLIISDLNMPRMTGFEFLAIVRERFPHIATIAMSGGHSSGEMPIGIMTDAFLRKGNYTIKELSQQVGRLLAASPLRSEKRKSDVAPLFVPRDTAGYLIITCPTCLRPNKLQAMSLNGGLHQTTCQTCGMLVRFEINHEIEPLTERKYA